MLFEQLHPIWQELLADQRELLKSIEAQLPKDSVPAKELILRAFQSDPREIRVLIIGQDPYPNPEHAIGLAFAVPRETSPLPPTLRNILTELRADIGLEAVSYGDLGLWANQGVMLLNRHLTTSAGQSAAHLSLGWAGFTARAVQQLVKIREHKLVAILWGNKAQELLPELSGAKILSSAHPSPLSAYRGFFGSRVFSQANHLLTKLGEPQIDWSC